LSTSNPGGVRLRISPEQRIGKQARSPWHLCALKRVLIGWRRMRTTLELPDPLFARLQGPLAIQADQLSNAALFELLDA
jgi:hypothetical protein